MGQAPYIYGVPTYLSRCYLAASYVHPNFSGRMRDGDWRRVVPVSVEGSPCFNRPRVTIKLPYLPGSQNLDKCNQNYLHGYIQFSCLRMSAQLIKLLNMFVQKKPKNAKHVEKIVYFFLVTFSRVCIMNFCNLYSKTLKLLPKHLSHCCRAGFKKGVVLVTKAKPDQTVSVSKCCICSKNREGIKITKSSRN